ncbi:MAG: hypothetical protein R3F14_46680 [Polyangiaceae bacterium]
MSASTASLRPPTIRRAAALLRRLLLGAALTTAAVGAAGCAGSRAAAMAPAHGEARGDVAGVVAVALAEADLRIDQRAKASAILADIEAAARPGREARLSLFEAMARGAERGQLSAAAMEPLIEAVTQADLAAAPGLQKAANDLHALLDEDQREAFVKGVKHGVKSRGLDLLGPKDELRSLAGELDLGWQQKRAIWRALRERFDPDRGKIKGSLSDARRRMRDTADAFESDSFDAESLAFAEDPDGVRELATRFPVAVVEAAIANMTADQRRTLAGYLRARASEP